MLLNTTGRYTSLHRPFFVPPDPDAAKAHSLVKCDEDSILSWPDADAFGRTPSRDRPKLSIHHGNVECSSIIASAAMVHRCGCDPESGVGPSARIRHVDEAWRHRFRLFRPFRHFLRARSTGGHHAGDILPRHPLGSGQPSWRASLVRRVFWQARRTFPFPLGSIGFLAGIRHLRRRAIGRRRLVDRHRPAWTCGSFRDEDPTKSNTNRSRSIPQTDLGETFRRQVAIGPDHRRLNSYDQCPSTLDRRTDVILDSKSR